MADGILALEEFACACLIDDDDTLRIGSVCFVERAAPKDGGLQCLEVAGSDVGFIRHDLRSSFLSAVNCYSTHDERAFVGQTEACGGMFYAWDPSHGGGAFVE